MRLRANQGKLKIEHSIIEGLRPVLERVLLHPEIRSIIPGVIRHVRDAKGKQVQIRITVETQNGWKGIALASGSRQELFVSTALTREELEKVIAAALAER